MVSPAPPHEILIAPEDEARAARYAAWTSCITLVLAVVVALVAWHAFAGQHARDADQTSARPVPSGAVSAQQSVPAASQAAGSLAAAANAPGGAGPANVPQAAASAGAASTAPLLFTALARMDPQASNGTLTVFVVDSARQVTELEQGLMATNAYRATGGAPALRATVVSAEADPEGFWLALAQSENEPFTVVDLRQP
ncbi:MAG TPA: hypothetical protein VKV26_18370 [Dehalococcoidia bacterium]|nr:hypothetical protein [Dehalococcoidia bacterium]